MELNLPVYVEVRRSGARALHVCRPLFAAQADGAHLEASHVELGTAMANLHKKLKHELDRAGGQLRQDRLADFAFAPPLETRIEKLKLDLRRGLVRGRFLLVAFPALDRTIAFSPSLPEVWFEVAAHEKVETRAEEVFSAHFRELEKQRPHDPSIRPEQLALGGAAWVTSIEIRVQTAGRDPAKEERKLASLFEEPKLNGDRELARVGRCLDWLYPDELSPATRRTAEAETLRQLLVAPDNRPVAIVGPRLSGKTAVLHECVRMRVAEHGKPYAAKRNVWLLSPQRLIAGMMVVGQWEGRLEAILRAARKRSHVLYFDDFLALYHAGISADASLSAADVMKPYILRREVRVLAEMTPQVWQRFAERDRGLADQFHLLRIDATGEVETRQIMLEVHRRLERRCRTKFALEALPTIVQLHRSYVRDAAFPGKSAAFSQRLAEKHAAQEINRDSVLTEFHEQTGLSLALVDPRRQIRREDVRAALGAKIVAQEAAIEAACDVVLTAKARLAPGDRPLATLLFLGPTGVGKTQSAKAIAETMFTDASRLLRFDMNEFGSAYAAARLVGTFQDPEGLLTSAVRRQPFAVVLFDEIEKAHPQVFDLLLQVTGEGRLTDAVGRTADFSSTVIVMTSNLGTKSSGQSIGLVEDRLTAERAYVRAAEEFFRPEFFNRIDRIVPFAALSREDMRKVAQLELKTIFQRDGLVRRRTLLAVEAAAMDRIVDAGYHPQFGARALKRSIEDQLVRPVAAHLSGIAVDAAALITILSAPGGVTAQVTALASALPTRDELVQLLTPHDHLARLERAMARFTAAVENLRPKASSRSVSTGSGAGLSIAQIRYYAVKEQLDTLRDLHAEVAALVAASEETAIIPQIPPRGPDANKSSVSWARRDDRGHRHAREVQAARDIHDYLAEAAQAAPRPQAVQKQLAKLLHEVALLESLLSSGALPEAVLLVIRPLIRPSIEHAARLFELFQNFGVRLGFDCERAHDATGPLPLWGLRIAGPGIWPLAQNECGVHLGCRRQENWLPVAVHVEAVDSSPARTLLATFAARRSRWLEAVARGEASPDSDPALPSSIVRYYDEAGPTLDLRSGESLAKFPTADEWQQLLLGGLPLPEEWKV